jgi:quercetin dioxygenase-like cupin family protein
MSQSPTPLRLVNKHTGEVLELLRKCDGGQLILELRGTLPPHQQGPPLHIHHFEDEDGIVTAGTLSAIVGGRTITAGPGESVSLPRGVPHRWWNDGDTQLAFHGTVRPLADLDRYLQAIFEVVNAGPSGRPPLFYMAHLVLRHGRTQTVLLMPPTVQAMLFRGVLALGTLLGRYRGRDWPGCPERCTGAPTAFNQKAEAVTERTAERL